MGIFTTCIYKNLWLLLNCLVSLYEFCLWLRLRLIAFSVWSYDQCRSTAERMQSDYEFLQQCKKHLTKIPKHLNLIIGPENSQVNDDLLTRIFAYALQMNINCVSFYDTRYTNISKTSKPVTALEKLECPKGWKRNIVNAHHSFWFICKDKILNDTIKPENNIPNGNGTALLNGHIDNTCSSLKNSCLEIYEIQPQNNRKLLALICRDLFKQKHNAEIQKLLENRTLLTERIDKKLFHHLESLTEPDLSIIFHEDMCTFGMLPWHTRFTEFHRHPSGQHFDAKTFAHILYKFSRCEQRWGK